MSDDLRVTTKSKRSLFDEEGTEIKTPPGDVVIPDDFHGVVQINVQAQRENDRRQDVPDGTASALAASVASMQQQVTQLLVQVQGMQSQLAQLAAQQQALQLMLALGVTPTGSDRQRIAREVVDSVRNSDIT